MLKGKMRLILEDHWTSFVSMYDKKIRPNVKAEVDKVLRCKDTRYGYIELKCEKCNEIKKVGFTCKSRFCTSCGKVYVDKWIESMLSKLINVRHRHIVFTIPEELRIYFGKDRSKLKLLPQSAANAVTSWMKDLNKSEEFTPGIVTVIHTFGRDLKCNPHVHMMITEGGTGKKTVWRHIKHISYLSLRKRWQKLLLDNINDIVKNRHEAKRLKDKLYRDKDKGFYVHAKTQIKSAKIAAKYIGRYVGCPAIAESRIIKYDRKNVTYKYTRHEDNKVVVETVKPHEFLKKVIIHIPEKHFKMIRYFGIYSRRSRKKDNITVSTNATITNTTIPFKNELMCFLGFLYTISNFSVPLNLTLFVFLHQIISIKKKSKALRTSPKIKIFIKFCFQLSVLIINPNKNKTIENIKIFDINDI